MPGGAAVGAGAAEATALLDAVALALAEAIGGGSCSGGALVALAVWVADGGTAGSTEGALVDEQAPVATRPKALARQTKAVEEGRNGGREEARIWDLGTSSLPRRARSVYCVKVGSS